MENKDNKTNSRHTSMRYLWGYVIALFAISLGLIFLSYGSQQRLKSDLLAANNTLTLEMENSDSMENALKLQQIIIDDMQNKAKDIGSQAQSLRGLLDELERLSGEYDTASEDTNSSAESGKNNGDDVTDREKMSDIISQMREVTDNLSRSAEDIYLNDK